MNHHEAYQHIHKGNPRRKRKIEWDRKDIWRYNDCNFSYFIRDINLHNQETQQIRENKKEVPTNTHYSQIFERQNLGKQQEKSDSSHTGYVQ